MAQKLVDALRTRRKILTTTTAWPGWCIPKRFLFFESRLVRGFSPTHLKNMALFVKLDGLKPQISGLKQKIFETTTQMVFSLILLVQKSCCFQKPPLHKTRRFAVHGNPAPPYLPRQIARKETENNNCWVSYLWEVICHITILLKKHIPLKIVDYQSLQRKKVESETEKIMFALDLQVICVHLFHPIIYFLKAFRNSHWFHHFPPSQPIPIPQGESPGSRGEKCTAPSYMAFRRGKCKRWCKPRASKPSPKAGGFSPTHPEKTCSSNWIINWNPQIFWVKKIHKKSLSETTTGPRDTMDT